MRRILVPAVVALSVALGSGPAPAEETPARDLFGAVSAPSRAKPATAIGSYAKGCLAGGVPLAIDGPAWQAMRLSRNRNWGHPQLVALVEKLALEAKQDGWNGLLVGDLAQPRGGPMRSGHASHQIGLDADIWLTQMPDRRLGNDERESMSAISMIKEGTREIDRSRFSPRHVALIRRAASYPEVARIFVHPGIKKALCEAAGPQRAWLEKVRPWWGHDYHFHIRIRCPDDSQGCKDQDSPPDGDGCGKELAWWLSDEPWKPREPGPPPKPLLMADLPSECRTVLESR